MYGGIEKLIAARGAEITERIWDKDPALWVSGEAEQSAVAKRLGWLDSVDWMAPRLDELGSWVESIKAGPWERVVLLGMGGSSLAPEVLSRIFGTAEGSLPLSVLDNTAPDAVREALLGGELEHTLFIVSSKSGQTIEIRAFLSFFFERMRQRLGDGAGQNFVAITDPDTELADAAKTLGFQRVFLNPADIGGRFSALSYFGLVPAALLGIDLTRLLASAQGAISAASRSTDPPANGALRLGVSLANFAAQGRDKMVLLMSDAIDPLGDWIEQLVAESTGKSGRGILPVVNEVPMPASSYWNDRVFVAVSLEGDRAQESRCAELHAAGHPVIGHRLTDRYDVGGEFFRWEFATAVAGAVLGINPFDEPDVGLSKATTEQLLRDEAMEDAHTPRELVTSGVLTAVGDPGSVPSEELTDVTEALRTLLATVEPEDYIAILAYLPDSIELKRFFRRIAARLGQHFGVAVTTGIGPRFQHSTGQLHKGGPHSGVFIQIVGDTGEDLSVPGQSYSFGELNRAQADGDLAVLLRLGRRAVRVECAGDREQGLLELHDAVERALSQ